MRYSQCGVSTSKNVHGLKAPCSCCNLVTSWIRSYVSFAWIDILQDFPVVANFECVHARARAHVSDAPGSAQGLLRRHHGSKEGTTQGASSALIGHCCIRNTINVEPMSEQIPENPPSPHKENTGEGEPIPRTCARVCAPVRLCVQLATLGTALISRQVRVRHRHSAWTTEACARLYTVAGARAR